MQTRRSLLRRLKLRTVLVVALLLSGIIPLGISSILLIQRSLKVLQNTERDNLTNEAKSLSLEVSSYLVSVRRQLSQFGGGVLTAPGPADTAERLLEPWVQQQLQGFGRGNPDISALRVLDPDGAGLHGRGLRAGAEPEGPGLPLRRHGAGARSPGRPGRAGAGRAPRTQAGG